MKRLIGRLRGDERGFTLIELLVSMGLGMVVLAAALGLMDSGARSTARTSDRADVTQRGRAVMTAVQRRLRSQVCVDIPSGTQSVTVPPITYADATTVKYYTDTDGDPYFAPQWHWLWYDSSWKGGRGAIRETVYKADQTAAQGPPFTFTGTPVSRVLAEDLTLQQQPDKPFLTYYPYNDTTTAPDESATALGTPLSQTVSGGPLAANSIAKVTHVDVSFRVRPGRPDGATGPPIGNQTDLSRDNDFDTSVYVRNSDYTDADQKNRVWGPRCS